MKEQQDIFKQSLKDNGRTFTQQFVALPGKSEHQTGLAIDLGLKKESIDFIRPDFPYIGICQQFREKSVPYGFIERYPREIRRQQEDAAMHDTNQRCNSPNLMRSKKA